LFNRVVCGNPYMT